MLTTNPTVFALLFSVGIAATYLVVRLGWFRTWQAFIVGSIVNSTFFFLFAITRANSLGHALTIGLCLGLLFTVLSVTLGQFFQRTEAERATRLVSMAAESLKS